MSRWAKRKSGSQNAFTVGRKTRSFSCRTAYMSISSEGIGKRGGQARRRVDGALRSVPSQVPGARRSKSSQMQRRELPAGWDKNLPVFPADAKGMAGRDASGQVLNVLAQNIPWLMGGSADLGPSNKTIAQVRRRRRFPSQSTPEGRNLHFGIREHSMAAIVNGLVAFEVARHLAQRFFIFSDYARPAIRLSALMELPTLFVFTHDAMGDGEDGPTHQPVEHFVSLRAIPGLVVLRPGGRKRSGGVLSLYNAASA